MRTQLILLGLAALAGFGAARPERAAAAAAAERQVEAAVLEAAGQPEQAESYQRVYEAFARLMEQTAGGSLANVRRLVSRLNNLVGQAPAPAPAQPKREQSADERTEQILVRLDQVTRDTDQHTLAQLNDDIGRLVGTLNEGYLRNLRRLIERVNRAVGGPGAGQPLHQSGDRLQDELGGGRQPGFPGWDELIGAVDRMQKNLAHFVRSSTRLVTGG